MFIAAWSFDMPYGTRQETLSLIKEVGGTIEKVAGWKGRNTRVLMGSIGAPESRILVEHEFASLADLEASWTALQSDTKVFPSMVQKMKPCVVSGSPRWEIYRIVS